MLVVVVIRRNLVAHPYTWSLDDNVHHWLCHVCTCVVHVWGGCCFVEIGQRWFLYFTTCLLCHWRSTNYSNILSCYDFIFKLLNIVVKCMIIFAEATPKTILRTMGVKGLTLFHLKSHLQVLMNTHMFFASPCKSIMKRRTSPSLCIEIRVFLRCLKYSCVILYFLFCSHDQKYRMGKQTGKETETSKDGKINLLISLFISFNKFEPDWMHVAKNYLVETSWKVGGRWEF